LFSFLFSPIASELALRLKLNKRRLNLKNVAQKKAEVENKHLDDQNSPSNAQKESRPVKSGFLKSLKQSVRIKKSIFGMW